MPKFNPAAVAAKWKRPYSSVEWAWVRALGVEPSAEWRETGAARAKRASSAYDGVDECFGNRRRVRI